MRMPFVSRAWYEGAVAEMETENWELRGRVRKLCERERARMACMEVLERDCEENRRARAALEIEAGELRERARLLGDDNRELRRRYDTARAEIARQERELKTLRLMKASLEARVGGACEAG